MSFDEEQQRRSRVVVETPTSRREVVQQQVTRIPEQRGVSVGVLVGSVIAAIALTALLVFLVSNRGDATNTNDANVAQASPLAAATPFPTPIVVPTIEPLPPTAALPPVTTVPSGPVVTEIPSTTFPSSTLGVPAASPTPDDGLLQSAVRGNILGDPEFAGSQVSVVVANGRATLTGTVPSGDARRRAERLAKNTRGIQSVNNQLTVAAAPATADDEDDVEQPSSGATTRPATPRPTPARPAAPRPAPSTAPPAAPAPPQAQSEG